MTGALAVALAAGAAMLVVGGRPNVLTMRLGQPARAPVRNRWSRIAPLHRRMLLGALVSAGVAAAGISAGPGGVVAVALAVPAGWIWLVRRRSHRARRRREIDIAEACLSLAGDLGAGVPPGRALGVAAREWPDLFAVAAGRATVGGDPVAALRESAQQPGASALTAVAAAWEVSERTGAGLSSVLVAVADSLRAEAAVRREADAQLASVRATSRLMALLPVATLVLFSAGDGDALHFLTGTPSGLVCLVLAAAFIAAGLFWVDRTARTVRSAWE